MSENPFGTRIQPDDIADTLGFFDDWEERYKYLIELGRELPPMADGQKREENLVRGCQSQVWVEPRREGGRFFFDVDSDAFIVKGLLGVVMSAYNNRSADEILAFDMEAFFERLDLLRHLSPTRGNGLRAMVARIRAIAEDASA